MSEMVERVARAYWSCTERPETWVEIDEDLREMCRDHARAAIEAMREPTKAMCSKAFVAKPQAYGAIGPLVWKAMIDEALR